MKTFRITRLEQTKLLSDPFKQKLLEEFSLAPATTKQIADRMGEKAPRLYRHVDALVAEGLLILIEEKQKRGTTERYYQTIAQRFEIDPNLFSPGTSHQDESSTMVRSLFHDTEADLLGLLSQKKDASAGENDQALLMKFSINASPDNIALLRQKLEVWLEECETISKEAQSDVGNVSYSGMIVYYPNFDEGS